jgi:hypothetical protein
MPAESMLRLADIAFASFHILLTTFNLVGWIWPRTRRLHLVVLSGTLLSWFGLGVAYGWGYCPLTDWHWQVKHALGERGLPASFVKYYADRVTGVSWDPALVDGVVVALAFLALGLSIALNVQAWRRGTAGRSVSR